MGANESNASHDGRAASTATSQPPSVAETLHASELTPAAAATTDRFLFLPEILELLAQFLVGFDVLQLSHSCRAFRSELSTRAVWAPRVRGLASAPSSWWCQEQETYFRARSLRFTGLDGLSAASTKRRMRPSKTAWIRPELPVECGDACELPFMLLPEQDGRLTFDLWFSLLESTSTQGGVLFGAQSESCFSRGRSPAHVDRFIHIDPERNLRCSVLVAKPVIAQHLELDRWYHLALSFDGTRQRVYLDGALVSSGRGLDQPQRKWHWVRCAQLGTGFLGPWSQGKPTADYQGWYPFHGLLDDFRVWYTEIPAERIQKLAQGELIPEKPVFQLSTDGEQTGHTGAERVKCSRPLERLVRIHPKSKPS